MAGERYIALESTSQEILETLKGMKPRRYGFRIKQSEASPANRVEYLYDAVGMTPASMNFATGIFNYGSWANIWFVRDNFPCMVKNDGTIDYKLNPSDYTKRAAKSTTDQDVASDIMDPAYAGNAMSAIPCVWYRRWTEGDYYYFVCCEDKYDDSYYADVHTGSDGKVHPYKLMAMFQGSTHSTKLRSLMSPGVLDPASELKFNLNYKQTATEELAAAKANNPDGKSVWTLREWNATCLLTDLLTLIGKSTDSQTAFGTGPANAYVADDSGTVWPSYHGMVEPGTLYNKGQFYGFNDSKQAVKVFHIENPWSNRWERLVGLVVVNGTMKVRLGCFEGEYNFTGDGYNVVGDFANVNTFDKEYESTDLVYYGYAKEFVGNRYGMFARTCGGSSSTYYADYQWLRTTGTVVPLVGGICRRGGYDGSRCLHCNYAAEYSNWDIGGSLSALEPV